MQYYCFANCAWHLFAFTIVSCFVIWSCCHYWWIHFYIIAAIITCSWIDSEQLFCVVRDFPKRKERSYSINMSLTDNRWPQTTETPLCRAGRLLKLSGGERRTLNIAPRLKSLPPRNLSRSDPVIDRFRNFQARADTTCMFWHWILKQLHSVTIFNNLINNMYFSRFLRCSSFS